MRIAFFSPMPPARSGIADYSAALYSELQRIADVEVFSGAPATYDPAHFDVALYQLGNNGDHCFVYEMAMRHPGVVMLHEANLHHLIAELTIPKGDWDAYVAACAADGGPVAEAFALRVKALETGPDYDGVPMLRRLLEHSRGAIAHSDYVLQRLRAAGFTGPAAIIPHGAWVGARVNEALSPNGYIDSRNSIRHRLGLDENSRLIGSFGYLKPYKRIAETLRALRRVVRLEPRVRMILGGEPHPDFPVDQVIRTLGLDAYVRVLGFTPEDEFASYIDACDVIVNLRYPTVGESSGSLLRAFSAGKPALVSDIGSFSELPGDICFKVPVGEAEEELLFEYLHLLVVRPDVARAVGAKARDWVERHCSWQEVAVQYNRFLQSVVSGVPLATERVEHSSQELAATIQPDTPTTVHENSVAAEDIRTWTAQPAGRDYFEQHSARLVRTLEITPPGDAGRSVLEMGSYMQITPALKFRLGYGTVRGCYYGQLGRVDCKQVRSEEGLEFECLIDHFDAEKDPYPYADATFDTVLCCELIEHLFFDPMHLMSEVNRILKPDGYLVLTTPNIISLRAIAAILDGYHPGFFTSYIRPNAAGEADARHNREYAPEEIRSLLINSGFEVTLLETGPFRDEPHPAFSWVRAFLERLSLKTGMRGDGIYAVGRKTGAIRERWPSWLFS